MKKLLASVLITGLCAIGCNEQTPSKPATTTTNTGAKPMAPSSVKPQADTPPTSPPRRRPPVPASKPSTKRKDLEPATAVGGSFRFCHDIWHSLVLRVLVMGKLLRRRLALIVLTALAFGCGTSGEKGANKDL